MRVLEKLQSVGQSLWLEHASREMIRNGSLMRFIEDRLITGLTFSPQAIHQALTTSLAYDSAITRYLGQELYGETLAYSLMYEDVRHAADLLRAVYDSTDGVDGWVVIPISPLSASDNDTLVSMLKEIHQQIHRPNVLLCFPALPDRVEIIEELVSAGVPINIANIYSDTHYKVIAKACLDGLERRINAGLKPVVLTFISINIARLETALSQITDRQTATDLSVAMARKIYRTLRELNNSQAWGRVFNMGVRPLRIIWTYSGGTGMLDANCDLYKSLIAPYTVVSLPDRSIEEFINQAAPEEPVPVDGGDCDLILGGSRNAGIEIDIETDNLQADYIDWMSKEWVMLLENIAKRSAVLSQKEAMG